MTKNVSLLLDVDGVLLDWGRHAARHKTGFYQLSDEWESVLAKGGMHSEEHDAMYGGREGIKTYIDSLGVHFWQTIPTFPWADELVSKIINLAVRRQYRLAFCTSPSVWPQATTPRLEYLDQKWPGIPTIITADKTFLAHDRAILLDDYILNIEQFNNAGGWGILTSNPYKEILNVDQIIGKIPHI